MPAFNQKVQNRSTEITKKIQLCTTIYKQVAQCNCSMYRVSTQILKKTFPDNSVFFQISLDFIMYNFFKFQFK